MSKNNLFYKNNKKYNILFYTAIIFIIGFIFAFKNESFVRKTLFIKNKIRNMKNEKQLPLWNLNDLYNGINDKKINEDIENIDSDIDKFSTYYKGNIKYLSSGDFYLFLKEYEKINENISKVLTFANLKYSENLSIEENVIFYQNINERINIIYSKLIFVELEINKLKESEINEKLKNNRPAIKNYSFYLKSLRKFKKYQMDEKLEKIFNEKSLTSRNAWSRLFDETIDNMTYNFEGKKLNGAQILDIVNYNEDESKRQKAAKIFGEKLGESIKLFAFITNTLAKDKAINDKWRGFKTPIASRNLSNLIDDKDVENLFESVQNNYKNMSHRYYKLKAKMLNKEKLFDYDRNVPLPFKNNKTYSWEEAKDIVLKAYYNFSPKMSEIGQLFFDNNWIDAPTRQGKSGGAFASKTIPSLHPYILLNFKGTERDVITLAHELGHGIHMYLSKEQNFLNYDTPLTLSETASVFGEQIVFRYLYEHETTKNGRIAILANKIEDMINTIVRQIAFLEFEMTVHNNRKTQELSVDELNNIWLNVQRKSLGDIFEFSNEYKYYWSYIPHFIHSPFYVYSYSFGNCLVNTLYRTYSNSSNKEEFVKKYIDLLKAGGSDSYIELLKQFDLDPKNKEFWNDGMQVLIDMIDQLENLLK